MKPPCCMGFYIVIFKEGEEVVQTVALPADSVEDAIAKVAHDRSMHPELGYFAPTESVSVSAHSGDEWLRNRRSPQSG